MNADQLQGKWQQLRGTLKQRWGNLTDDDLTYIDGSLEKLAGSLRERYGIEQAQADRMIEEWDAGLPHRRL